MADGIEIRGARELALKLEKAKSALEYAAPLMNSIGSFLNFQIVIINLDLPLYSNMI